jgi:hypothetical protein
MLLVVCVRLPGSESGSVCIEGFNKGGHIGILVDGEFLQ